MLAAFDADKRSSSAVCIRPVLSSIGSRVPREFLLSMLSQESEIATASGHGFSLPESVSSLARDAAGGRAYLAPERYFRYHVIKRALDVFLILLASPLLLLLLALIAAAVSLGSPGPVFFSHRRIRRHGAFFTMWKFRTMCVDSAEVLENYLTSNPEARAEWRKSHKLKHDPRITPVGHFLRRTSLDELPQLWNVLSGSMSLVGPRPIVAAEVEKYGEFFADYCLVKPGITGLWQVSGRCACTYPERVQMDRRYAHHWSLTADVEILIKTLPSVINQDGAY
jgi:Undecaprenyl-phosphate galactose phosphotransferase WbaP